MKLALDDPVARVRRPAVRASRRVFGCMSACVIVQAAPVNDKLTALMTQFR